MYTRNFSGDFLQRFFRGNPQALFRGVSLGIPQEISNSSFIEFPKNSSGNFRQRIFLSVIPVAIIPGISFRTPLEIPSELRRECLEIPSELFGVHPDTPSKFLREFLWSSTGNSSDVASKIHPEFLPKFPTLGISQRVVPRIPLAVPPEFVQKFRQVYLQECSKNSPESFSIHFSRRSFKNF